MYFLALDFFASSNKKAQISSKEYLKTGTSHSLEFICK
jgi:hypothetical protein